VFLDSDDLMHRNHLSSLAKIIAEHRTRISLRRSSLSSEMDAANRRNSKRSKKAGTGLSFCTAIQSAAFFVSTKKSEGKAVRGRQALRSDGRWMFLVENLVDDRIYIRNEITITVVDHAGRSMRSDNRRIIEKLLAAEWIAVRVNLSEQQKRILSGRVFYFARFTVTSMATGKAQCSIFSTHRRNSASAPTSLYYS
jgi:hypothetical protein